MGEVASARRRVLGRAPGAVLSLPLLLFFALPIAAIVWKSDPQMILGEVRTTELRSAVSLSLRTTFFAALLTIVFGTPLAFLLGRGRFFGRGFVQVLVELPTVLPPAAAGLGLLLAFGRRGLLGHALPWPVAFTTSAVVLAELFVAAPFFVRTLSGALEATDLHLEEQAAVDGASTFRIQTRILLPLLSAPFITGLTLTSARALGEFGATILFAGNLVGRTQTMPLALYVGFEQDPNRATALAAILLTIAFLLLLLASSISRQSSKG